MQIDVASGTIASDWCGESRKEWFKPGTEPRTQCTGFTADLNATWEGIRGVIAGLPNDDHTERSAPDRGASRDTRTRTARSSDDEISHAISAVARKIGQSQFTQDLARKLMDGIRTASREGANVVREQKRQMEREHARQMARARAEQRRAQQSTQY